MNSKLIAAIVFLLMMVAVVPLMLRISRNKKPQPVTIAELDAGQDRTIRITVEPNSQGTLSLHYHVDADGQPTVEHAFLGTLPRTSPPPKFVTYFAQDGGLVGVAQASAPNTIVILHDFAADLSFPMKITTYKDTDPKHLYPYYEDLDSILARGDGLFDRLAQAHPDSPLKLLRTMGMRPLVLPGGDGAEAVKDK